MFPILGDDFSPLSIVQKWACELGVYFRNILEENLRSEIVPPAMKTLVVFNLSLWLTGD